MSASGWRKTDDGRPVVLSFRVTVAESERVRMAAEGHLLSAWLRKAVLMAAEGKGGTDAE